jgi:queuine tRNA-ribosyltransferase
MVFSLAEINKIDDEGVTFRSHLDGSKHRLTPEKSMHIQENLGADVIMTFDECADPHENILKKLLSGPKWAERCLSTRNGKTRHYLVSSRAVYFKNCGQAQLNSYQRYRFKG